MRNKKFACMLTGVGGQGTVLASRILAQAYMNKGFECRTAETIGMSQRGGTVISHVQTAPTLDEIPNSLIDINQADLILAFEPGEALRALPHLKPDGLLVTNTSGIRPVTASLDGIEYSGKEQLQHLRDHVKNLIEVPGKEICEKLGSAKVLNIVLVGAALGGGAFELTQEKLEEAIKDRVKPHFIELNLRALDAGITCSCVEN